MSTDAAGRPNPAFLNLVDGQINDAIAVPGGGMLVAAHAVQGPIGSSRLLIPISAAQDTAGPIARNATDAAAVLSVIQGVDSADPSTAAAAPYVGRNYLSALNAGVNAYFPPSS